MTVRRYLRLRGGTYACRIRIPRQLRSIVKRSEVVISLRTGRFALALRSAREIRVGLDRIVTAMEQGLSLGEVERRVRAWIARLTIEFQTKIVENDGLSGLLSANETEAMGAEQATEIDWLLNSTVVEHSENAKRTLVRAATGITRKDDPVIEALVAAAANGTKVGLSPGSLQSKGLRQAVLRNLQTFIDATAVIAKGGPIPEQILSWVASSIESTTDSAVPSALANANRPISELWDPFRTSKFEGAEWNENEKRASKSTIGLWIKIRGDRRPMEYSPQDVEQFRHVYRKLPKNYYHNKEWRRIYETDGPKVLAEIQKADNVKLTSAKSWNKHLSRLNEFWHWAAFKGEVIAKDNSSLMEGFFIPIKKNKYANRMNLALREKFEEEHIKKMLSAPVFLGCKSPRKWKERGPFVFRNHRYWMILLGLLTGMRREEPLLLKVKHVKRAGETWYFDLLDPELVPILKDGGSPRLVPLHEKLIELGFIADRVWGRPPEARYFLTLCPIPK